jgi:hypothetical protein
MQTMRLLIEVVRQQVEEAISPTEARSNCAITSDCRPVTVRDKQERQRLGNGR